MTFSSGFLKIFGSRNFRIFLAAIFCASVLLCIHLSRLPDGALIIDVLDVGQGDAILITTPDRHRVLIDGGPGQKVLRGLGATMPFLSRRIDVAILTHPHADHVEGLVPVFRRYDIGTLMITGVTYQNAAYEALLQTARTQKPWHKISSKRSIVFADADDDFEFGDVSFDILYPFEPMIGESIKNVNNSSLVVMVRYKEHAILLAGDAEIEAEEALIAAHDRGEINLNAELLKAGHHGSLTSSMPEFVRRVDPETVIISSGAGNSFGHPSQKTLAVFQDLCITIRRTDKEGNVSAEFK